MTRGYLFILSLLFVCGVVMPAAGAEGQAANKKAPAEQSAPAPEYAGEIFGVKVPMQNYWFVKAGISVFGNKWGAPIKNEQDLENATWDQLILSLIAFNENITIPREDVLVEVGKTLAAEGVKFDWKSDKAAYAAWVKEKTRMPVEVFEEEIRHLMQLQKLREKVIAAAQPDVSEDEARQKFLNENSMLSVELVEFAAEKDAEAFYKKVKGKAAAWEKEKKARSKDFKRPGFVSLEFLIDLWKFPVDACYKMVQMPVGDVYPPRPIYKGYAVFKVLEKRGADAAAFGSSKDAYMEKVRNIKKIDSLGAWLKNTKEQAQVKVYTAAVAPKAKEPGAKASR